MRLFLSAVLFLHARTHIRTYNRTLFFFIRGSSMRYNNPVLQRTPRLPGRKKAGNIYGCGGKMDWIWGHPDRLLDRQSTRWGHGGNLVGGYDDKCFHISHMIIHGWLAWAVISFALSLLQRRC
ncbi:hypothetical protein F4782DRAFT_231982 [Xylaria castorea]|nr:hypothetical protein F4782DRAFT_231982 [Xylaria castorea]